MTLDIFDCLRLVFSSFLYGTERTAPFIEIKVVIQYLGDFFSIVLCF